MTEKKVLMKAEHLTKEYGVRSAFGVKKKEAVHAVSDVSIEIYQGETLSLVGESGCGKSTLGRLLVRLLEPTSGKIWYKEDEITRMPEKELNRIRQKIQMVFQDPYSSLDPRMTVEKLISEPMMAQKIYRTKEERKGRVLELMHMVGIRPEMINRYPHQFSGGQRQRIGIARALALNPELLVCDEPVSALDVSIQAQILNLLKDLQQQFGLTYLFISHDLSVVHYISDRICVMFLGKICEIGDTETIYSHPLHPYTRFLMNAVPQPDPDRPRQWENLLSGDIPSAVNPPSGCRFHTRCPYARPECSEKEPELRDVDGRKVACHFPLTEKYKTSLCG